MQTWTLQARLPLKKALMDACMGLSPCRIIAAAIPVKIIDAIKALVQYAIMSTMEIMVSIVLMIAPYAPAMTA